MTGQVAVLGFATYEIVLALMEAYPKVLILDELGLDELSQRISSPAWLLPMIRRFG